MYSALEGFDTPIVAIACQDHQGTFHFYYCETPIQLKDMDFQDELLRIGDFYIPYHWLNSVVICTEETLEELKRELENA